MQKGTLKGLKPFPIWYITFGSKPYIRQEKPSPERGRSIGADSPLLRCIVPHRGLHVGVEDGIPSKIPLIRHTLEVRSQFC